MRLEVKGIEVEFNDSTITENEIEKYIEHIKAGLEDGERVKKLSITVDGDYVDLNYTVCPQSFERIRRITGYLVGTLDNWNDAKRAEETDRTKHSYVIEGLE